MSRFNEYFGFTQKEVDQILLDAGTASHAQQVKAWYDGYHFGEYDIYCPWDVMNFVRDFQFDATVKPASYWKNTSDNAIIRSLLILRVIVSLPKWRHCWRGDILLNE